MEKQIFTWTMGFILKKNPGPNLPSPPNRAFKNVFNRNWKSDFPWKARTKLGKCLREESEGASERASSEVPNW